MAGGGGGGGGLLIVVTGAAEHATSAVNKPRPRTVEL
jgi:hypothetical protein